MKTQQAELDRLRAMLDAVHKEQKADLPTRSALYVHALKDVATLRARIAELEAALEPFAIYGQQLPERYQYEFETVLLEATPGPNITVGDVRRAAELLKRAAKPT